MSTPSEAPADLLSCFSARTISIGHSCPPLGRITAISESADAEIAKATDWQNHSIRGFISVTLNEKMGLKVESEKTDAGGRSASRSNLRRNKKAALYKRAAFCCPVSDIATFR
jgi:hypothetical protein